MNKIDTELAKELFNFFDKGVLISTFRQDGDRLFQTANISQGTKLYLDDRFRDLGESVEVLENLEYLEDAAVMALTYIDTEEQVMTLKEKIEARYKGRIILHTWSDMYYKPWFWMTIHSKASTKAHGLNLLKTCVNIDYDELIVFGDNINDLEMFKVADQAIAVENAVEILKSHATEVIGHHNADSVVKKILDMEGHSNDVI